jgi:hypothetical protein
VVLLNDDYNMLDWIVRLHARSESLPGPMQSTTWAWDVGVDLSGNTPDLASFSTVSHKGEGSMFGVSGVTGQRRKSRVWLLNLRSIRKCVKHNCFPYITANLEAKYEELCGSFPDDALLGN